MCVFLFFRNLSPEPTRPRTLNIEKIGMALAISILVFLDPVVCCCDRWIEMVKTYLSGLVFTKLNKRESKLL